MVQGVYYLLERAGVLRRLRARPQLHSARIPHRSLPQVHYAARAAAGCRCCLLCLHVDVLDILGLLLATTLGSHLVGIRVSFTPTYLGLDLKAISMCVRCRQFRVIIWNLVVKLLGIRWIPILDGPSKSRGLHKLFPRGAHVLAGHPISFDGGVSRSHYGLRLALLKVFLIDKVTFILLAGKFLLRILVLPI